MKRIPSAGLAGAAMLAWATPALALDRYDRGAVSRRASNDYALRQRVRQVSYDLNRAYREGVIDHGALHRAMTNVNSYRIMMRDGTTPFEARHIERGLNDIERAIVRHRHGGRRG